MGVYLLTAGFVGAQAATQNYYYDPAGRLIVVVDPASGSATYNYDANGNIVSVARSPLTTVVAAQVSPSAAAPGATVTISGTAFGTTANTTVSFNGKAATISAATSTSLTVTVPSGATSGPVKVTAPGGSATTLYSFTVLGAAPTVTGVPSGALAQGATMTITGTGFDTTPANNVVIINGVRAQATAATATQLTVTAPAACVGVSPVQVETAYGAATSANSVTILPAGQTAASLQAVVSSALGSSANVSFDGTGRAVMLTFAATQGQAVILSLPAASASLNGTTTLGLYTPNGDTLYLNTTSNQIVSGANFGPYRLPAAGVYSLWLVPPASTSGTVTVTLANVSAAASATLTTSGAAVPVTTTVGGQQMQATFNATGGTIVALQISSSLPNSATNNWDHNLNLMIGGPNGPIYAGSVSVNSFTQGLTLPASGTGTYTAVVTPSAADFGTLNFTLYNVPAPASASVTANGSATVLTTTIPGQTFAASFTGAAGQVVALDLQVQSGTLASGNGDLVAITGPSGQIYSFGWSWFSGSHLFSGPITLPVAGSYTITDVPAGLETGAMQFTLYTVPPPASATLTVGGGAANVTTTVPAQNMSLTFAGNAGQRVSLYVQDSSGLQRGCAPLTVTEPDGTTQLYSNGCFNYATNFTGALVLPTTGVYTILYNIGASGAADLGTATFTLYPVPADPSAAITIGGAAVSLATTAPGQRMILTFSASAGQTISLLSNNYTGTLASEGGQNVILAPDGSTQVYSGSLCCGGAAYSGNINLTQTGTYTITLTPNPISTGGVTFQLYNEAALTSTLTPGGGSVGITTTAPQQTVNLTMPETSGHRVAVLVQFNANFASQDIVFSILSPDGTTSIWNSNMIPGSSLWTGALPGGPLHRPRRCLPRRVHTLSL